MRAPRAAGVGGRRRAAGGALRGARVAGLAAACRARRGAVSLAVCAGALGDTVLLLPALAALARADPPLVVWGPARERLGPLLAPRGPAAEVAAYPRWALPLWGDAPGSPDATLRARLAGLGRLVVFGDGGPLAAHARALGGSVVPFPRPGTPGPHAVDAVAEGFEAATGIAVADRVPRLAPTRADLVRGLALAGARGEGPGHVVVHPGSGGRAKCWAAEGFARALDAAGLSRPPEVAGTRAAGLARGGLEGRAAEFTQGRADDAGPPWVVVALGPAEVERGLPGLDALTARRRVVVPGSLDDLVALLAGARAYLGNDAGPAHLAAALGVPVVVVFGASDPGRWAPRGRARVEVVHAPGWVGLDPARVGGALRRALDAGPADDGRADLGGAVVGPAVPGAS